MKIAVAKEVDPTEPRVAATPDTVKKMKALGADVVVQAGAGVKSGVLDADYEAAGATIARARPMRSPDADVVFKVRRPSEAELDELQAAARSSWRSWTRTAMRPRSPRWPRPASSASRWS